MSIFTKIGGALGNSPKANSKKSIKDLTHDLRFEKISDVLLMPLIDIPEDAENPDLCVKNSVSFQYVKDLQIHAQQQSCKILR